MGGERMPGAKSDRVPRQEKPLERPPAPIPDVADTLTTPQNAEQKAQEIIEDLAKITHPVRGRGTKLFNTGSQYYSVNKLIFALVSLKSHVISKIEEGAEYVGYSDGGMVLTWFKNGRSQVEINPMFLDPEIQKFLSEAGKLLLQEKQREVADSAFTEASMKQSEEILVYLKQAGLVPKNLSSKKIMDSEFGQELYTLLLDGIKNGAPFSWMPDGHGFVLKNYFGKFKDEPFDMRRFDKNLNYPRESAEQKADRYIAEKILPFLRGARPGLSDEKMLNSWLIQEEVKPVVFEGYKGDKPYEFVKEGANFRLKCKAEGFKDQVFNMGDYDQDLSLLKPKSEPVTAVQEPQVEKEGQKASGHHEDREIFQIKTGTYVDAYDGVKAIHYAEQKPDVQSVNAVIDQIVDANPAFSDLAAEMKGAVEAYMEQLETGGGEEYASKEVESIIAAEDAIPSGDKDMKAGFSVFKDLLSAIAENYAPKNVEHGSETESGFNGAGGHGPNSGNEAHDGRKTTAKSMK